MLLAKDLRQAVLQAALQGKLTEQLETDSNVDEMLVRIREEKGQLIAEKKIKKEKPLPDIREEEIPFGIPENWRWVRWGDLAYSIQYGYNAPAQEVGKIKMVRISDIQDNSVNWDSVPYCDIKDEEIETYLLKENDILFARTGGTVGKTFLVNSILEEAIYAGYLIRTRYNVQLVPKYLKMFMESQLYWIQLQNGKTQGCQPNCNGRTLSKMLLPLPPTEEQKRIVDKINEIMLRIDEYEKLEKELEILKKEFPVNMKDALLQAAMQGKLTKQLENDSSVDELLGAISEEKRELVEQKKIKKEKPLPVIEEEEIPFDIPENWSWMRLGEISTYSQPKEKVISKDITLNTWVLDLEDIEKETGRIVVRNKAKNKKIVGDRVKFSRNDILYSKLRPYLLKIIIAPADGVCTPELVPFRLFGGISAYYVMFILKSSYVNYAVNSETYGMKMPRVGTETMLNLLIPIPPLEEQHRIAERLDALLPLCEDLKEKESI